MTFVVLTGALIASTGAAKVGMIYIATHALFSYFKAGLAKAKYREWWNGQAISTFLSRSFFPNIQMVSTQLIKYRWLSKCAGWLTLFFEFSVVGLLFFPQLSMLYMAIAIVFHLSIYFCVRTQSFFLDMDNHLACDTVLALSSKLKRVFYSRNPRGHITAGA